MQLNFIISVLTAVALLLTSVFYEYKLSFVQTVMLFIGFGATFTCISPLIDSLSIKYMNGGRNINYPICRAAGSCAWAVACVLFGVFCDRYDANRLLILQMLFTAMMLAVLLVTEARHRLRSRAIPKAFRGLPITLVYIGVLALAIYGFTGHSVIL